MYIEIGLAVEEYVKEQRDWQKSPVSCASNCVKPDQFPYYTPVCFCLDVKYLHFVALQIYKGDLKRTNALVIEHLGWTTILYSLCFLTAGFHLESVIERDH